MHYNDQGRGGKLPHLGPNPKQMFLFLLDYLKYFILLTFLEQKKNLLKVLE